MEHNPFRWLSPLGIGTALFLGWGALNVFVGVVAPIAIRNAGSTTRYFIVSARSDAVIFGAEPSKIATEQPHVRTVRDLLVYWMSGLWVSFGLTTLAITWYALRRGELWALTTLTITGLATLVSFGLVFEPYLRRGAPMGIGDLPPLFLYPAVLLVPAVVLSWIGLK